MPAPQSKKQNFRNEVDGNVGLAFALALVPMLSMVGAAIDTGGAMSARVRLQALVDQAAIAGARVPATSDDRRLAAAQGIYDANVGETGLSGISHTIDANNSDVKVQASFTYKTSIMKILGYNEIPLSVTASARPHIDNGGVACILALNETASDSFHLQGINESNSQNCWVWVNSSSTSSMSATGAAVATAQGFCTYGGIYGSEHFGPRPYKGCSRMVDPFHEKFSTYNPPSTICDHTDLELKSGTHTLQPGVYCGDTVFKPQAHVTLQPGVYVMKNGSLEVKAGSSMIGDGVTIFFWGFDTGINVQGGANIDIKAPGTGELAGFVLVDRKLDWYNSTIYESVIRGGGTLKIQGVLYAPQWKVVISGNSEMNADSKCFAMIADQFYMEGNGKLNVVADCPNAGLPTIMPKIKSGPKMML